MEQAVSGKDLAGFGHGFGEKVFQVEFNVRVGGCHRFGSCAFGGIEITTIFCPFDRPAVCAQRGAVNPRSPGGVPEAKRGAAFCAASTRAAGQGLTGGAERSAIVAGRKDKIDRSDPGAAKRSDVPLGAYIKAAGIEDDRKGWLFRSAIRKTKKLTASPMTRKDVWCMVRRRVSDAGIESSIGCHSFRATGITDYLTNGGRIEGAQRMAGHSNAKTTGLYDRRNDDGRVGEVERIGI